MKVRQDEFGSRTPKVSPEDLEGDVAVLKIASVDKSAFDDEEGKRDTLSLTFDELGEKVLYLNSTQIGYLIERLGEETDDWIGQYVPIEKHTSSFRGKRFPKVWVCAPEEWDEALREAGHGPREKRQYTPRKKVARVVKAAKRAAKR